MKLQDFLIKQPRSFLCKIEFTNRVFVENYLFSFFPLWASSERLCDLIEIRIDAKKQRKMSPSERYVTKEI